MSFDAAHCTLCPRQCSADRTNGVGACHCGTEIRIARAALHYWEEPCISGKDGSGAVFLLYNENPQLNWGFKKLKAMGRKK